MKADSDPGLNAEIRSTDDGQLVIYHPSGTDATTAVQSGQWLTSDVLANARDWV